MLKYFFFCVLINFAPPIFFVSAERNDQTEQEERREIKQRLNRKVRILTHTPEESVCDRNRKELPLEA